MNPFCKFSSDGHSYTCNLCGATNDVPSFYYSTVDGQGRRFDSLERPEKKEVMKSDGVVRRMSLFKAPEKTRRGGACV